MKISNKIKNLIFKFKNKHLSAHYMYDMNKYHDTDIYPKHQYSMALKGDIYEKRDYMKKWNDLYADDPDVEKYTDREMYPNSYKNHWYEIYKMLNWYDKVICFCFVPFGIYTYLLSLYMNMYVALVIFRNIFLAFIIPAVVIFSFLLFRMNIDKIRYGTWLKIHHYLATTIILLYITWTVFCTWFIFIT